jgi:protein O-GlcNAc transferase
MNTQLAEEIESLDRLALQAQARNDLDGAMQYYQKILELAPASAFSYLNLATIALLQGNYDGAINCDEIALKLQPNAPQVHNHLGIVYQKAGRLKEALRHFENALTITPNDPFTLCNFAGLCTDDPVTARELFYRVFQPLISQFADKIAGQQFFFTDIQANALVCYINICLDACEWELAAPLYPLLEEITKEQLANNYQPAITPYLATIIFKNPNLVLEIAHSYASIRNIDIGKRFTHFEMPENHVHIGYLYNGFDSFVYNQAFLKLIANYDKNKFIVSIIHSKPLPLNFVQALEPLGVKFISIEHLSFYFSAQRIHEHNVHVLLDTTTSHHDSKPEILNFNPANVQVNFLNYFGTMGAKNSVQFVIADQHLIPEYEHQYYVESIIKLPTSMAFPKLTTKNSLKRNYFELPADKLVFANFSSSIMIDSVIFEGWMRILLQVPNSVLWLHDSGDLAKNSLLKKAEEYGMDPARLFFTKYNPLDEVFIHQLCDFYLDTSLANSEHNIMSALYCDKPIIAMRGNSPISRISNSILITANLEQCLCADLETYVNLASTLATNKKDYKELVAKIKQARENSELFSLAKYSVKLEQAFFDMLTHHKI